MWGDGGVVLYEKRHAEVGELLLRVSQPGDLRTRLIEKGRERVQSFSFGTFKARLQELLSGGDRQREAQGA